ncbi:hypothetical protein V7S43_008970 [Phytophthora oleae]|uniref:Uncharacterized protein n=1 Tax=Phytophthora oleae TaxID=2107226 RepID=A0ABD3FGW2_9STRA
MDNDSVNVKEEQPILLSDEEGEAVTTGESSADEEALMIVPAEFQTARSYDDDDDPTLPRHPVVGLLESLRTENADEIRFVEILEAIIQDLELSTAWAIVEREGLLTFMELVWKNYSEACTIHALELLQSIAGLSPDFVATLIRVQKGWFRSANSFCRNRMIDRVQSNLQRYGSIDHSPGDLHSDTLLSGSVCQR